MNYDSIKRLAKQLGKPVTELIALSPQNDPFYTGTPRDLELGAWFRDLWHEFGYSSGVHIRRMHYQLVSQNPPVRFPNGTPYENTERCWGELINAAKAARYLEYVDPGAFVDRRNEDPIDRLEYWQSRYAEADVTSVDSSPELSFPDMSGPPRYSLGYSGEQRYHLEVWCEKSTMNDILEPLVRQFQAALVFGKGELSITAALAAINRYQRTGKPVRIFYVSDFDPAGAGMPVSMARKLEYFVRNMNLDLDIRLYPVVLTYDQTKAYTRLLPTPIKDTERRKTKFEAKYGGGAIELDALEALYPGELRRVLQREMSRYFDADLKSQVEAAANEIRERLRSAQGEVFARYADQIQALDQEWEAIKDSIRERMQAHLNRRTALWQEIREELTDTMPDVDETDIPEAEEADEREGALYDSTRSYLDQNRVYQAHRANMSNLADLDE